MIIQKSRRLYGVCDPFQVLKEGQVHIRITVSREGPATPIHGVVGVISMVSNSYPKFDHNSDISPFC
jgi:hypothetical protein